MFSIKIMPDRSKPAAATVQEVNLTVKVAKTCILLVIEVGGQKPFYKFHAE